MNGKKYWEKKDVLAESSQIVTAIDAFTASDYLVSNSMDNVEGMLRLLMNNPDNLTILKYPIDITQKASVERITPFTKKFQKKAASIIHGFSAESMIQTNRQFMRNSAQGLKSTKNIKSRTSSSSTTAPYVCVAGPVRVQTVQKIDGRPMNKLFIDEILELYGSGVKYPSKELISIKPKILKSLPVATGNTPITVQSVRVGRDYVRIDRKMEIERSNIKLPPAVNAKEMVKFGGDELFQENSKIETSRKSKSEAALSKTPVFSLIGPLVITTFQNTVHDSSSGCYKIYEEIELRADRSTAKPEIVVIPFLRKVSQLPNDKAQQLPFRYQEDILIGHNVMLIKRIVEIKPLQKKQVCDLSLSEERNYVTDETIRTPSTMTELLSSNIGERRKMLVLQEPPIRTDFTISNDHSAEPALGLRIDSAGTGDRIGEKEGNLRTANGSSEMLNEGRSIVKTFDKFQVFRQPSLISGKTPTEAFMKAELHTAHSINTLPTIRNSEMEDYALQAHSDSLHTGLSHSIERMKYTGHASATQTPTKAFMSAELFTARSAASFSKRSHLDNDDDDDDDDDDDGDDAYDYDYDYDSDTQKQCKGSFFVPTNESVMNSDSTIQQIHGRPSSSTLKTASSFTGFPPYRRRHLSSPSVLPLTPMRSPRQKKKHKKNFQTVDEDKIHTAVLPEGFTSSSSTYTNRSASAVNKINISDEIQKAASLSSRFQRFPETSKQTRDDRKFSQKMLQMSNLNKASNFHTRNPVLSSSSSSQSQERKFRLLPPTPSIISAVPQRSSSKHTMKYAISQTMSSKEASLSTTDKNINVTSRNRKLSRRDRSRFQRFPLEVQSSASATGCSQLKRPSSPVSITQESDDVKSSAEREPSKWFEKDIFMEQPESESTVQTSRFIIPVSDNALKITDSTRQITKSESDMTKKALSAIPDQSAKQKTEATQTKGTSVMIQSKDEKNLTIELNINFQIKNENKTNSDHCLELQRISMKGRDIYRKSGIYQL